MNLNINWSYISSSQPWFYGSHLGKKFHKLENDVFSPINSPANDMYSNPQACSLSKMTGKFYKMRNDRFARSCIHLSFFFLSTT